MFMLFRVRVLSCSGCFGLGSFEFANQIITGLDTLDFCHFGLLVKVNSDLGWMVSNVMRHVCLQATQAQLE